MLAFYWKSPNLTGLWVEEWVFNWKNSEETLSFSSSVSSVLILEAEGGLVSSELTLWLSGWSVKLCVTTLHLSCL